MDRRTALGTLAALATSNFGVRGAAETPPRSSMGLLTYSRSLRRQAQLASDPEHDLFDPLTFLKHCQSLGLSGMQTPLGMLQEAEARALAQAAVDAGMYIEGIVSPPRDEGDVSRFEGEVQTAAWAGALAMRTVVMPGRRYEQFNSLDEFSNATRQAMRSLELAAPVVEKLKVPLAVENHKDHRLDQRVRMLKAIDSEYVGACVDTGNNIALLDDPLETVKALAPWVRSIHLKDQALAPYKDGFLLADIALGEGCLPLQEMIALLKAANPAIRFSLELITRDPLQIPVYTEKYWATFPDLPGRELARTMRLVQEHHSDSLLSVADKSTAERVRLEDDNIRRSVTYAREKLGL